MTGSWFQLSRDVIQRVHDRLARSIYLKHFFIGPELWSLPRPYDAAMFDQAVNGGTTAAIKILQRALNRQGKPFLKVDGQLGWSAETARTVRAQILGVRIDQVSEAVSPTTPTAGP
ncbi:MAG: hypothetical protein H2041_01380 [Phenylobacterium sp.]|uniref:hypothetical protein n=1 Tax=Phenylobacterium sp. TaxID=1871053 RepID=UPI0018270CED|nr:hypothetical protein [Phenylobacterium sp.]MBA4792297.1 hypothetical protein [Phenylobacterium sp.]